MKLREMHDDEEEEEENAVRQAAACIPIDDSPSITNLDEKAAYRRE